MTRGNKYIYFQSEKQKYLDETEREGLPKGNKKQSESNLT